MYAVPVIMPCAMRNMISVPASTTSAKGKLAGIGTPRLGIKARTCACDSTTAFLADAAPTVMPSAVASITFTPAPKKSGAPASTSAAPPAMLVKKFLVLSTMPEPCPWYAADGSYIMPSFSFSCVGLFCIMFAIARLFFMPPSAQSFATCVLARISDAAIESMILPILPLNATPDVAAAAI